MIPPQELVWLGGPTSGPGYDYHAFAAASGATAHAELKTRVPFPSFPLGRFGRTPDEATLAPFAHAIWVGGARSSPNGANGVFPSVGVGLASPFELLRFDVARGLSDGRWTFSVDIDRAFWSVL
jgi:hemolysin activation/secretion protein